MSTRIHGSHEVFEALIYLEDAASRHSQPIALKPVFAALQRLYKETGVLRPFVKFWAELQKNPKGGTPPATAALKEIYYLLEEREAT